MLISVHIPKTGGSTFQALLLSYFGEKLFLDYADQPMTHGNLMRKITPLKNFRKTKEILDSYACVHGHFLPIKYYLLNKDNIFSIWLRDPVERVVSRYYHWTRHKKEFRGRVTFPENMTLEQFCKIRHFHNLYYKYLWGMDINKFNFIGITEKYDSSVEVFRRQFNISLDNKIPKCNDNPLKLTEKYNVGPKLKKLIYKTNRKDMAIYKLALKKNQELRKKYNVKELN